MPDVPPNRVAHADGYGNLKTTIPQSAIASGSVVYIWIGHMWREARVSDGSFEVEEGSLAFASGSSGWPDPSGGGETVWMKLFLRGGSAWEEFGRPPFGLEVEVKTGA